MAKDALKEFAASAVSVLSRDESTETHIERLRALNRDWDLFLPSIIHASVPLLAERDLRAAYAARDAARILENEGAPFSVLSIDKASDIIFVAASMAASGDVTDYTVAQGIYRILRRIFRQRVL